MIKDGVLRFRYVMHEDETSRNACRLIFIESLRCHHTSMGIHLSHLISTVITLAMNDQDSLRVYKSNRYPITLCHVPPQVSEDQQPRSTRRIERLTSHHVTCEEIKTQIIPHWKNQGDMMGI